jgi:hypothetical protein
MIALDRRTLITGLLTLPTLGLSARAISVAQPEDVLQEWYKLVLKLVRHTPTMSPPVASRAFAYLGIVAYECVAASSEGSLTSLAGQLNALTAVPKPKAEPHDTSLVLHAALTESVKAFFGNTGPTGQRVLTRFTEILDKQLESQVTADVATRSRNFGRAIFEHVNAWSQSDGGAVVENMGFPTVYEQKMQPARWLPTNAIALQQKPLLPSWGNNRTFAMPHGGSCPLPPPPTYSEDQDSAFYREAMEVLAVSKSLTPEQRTIARFWSDDPMLSPTPPGHWISIALQIMDRDQLPLNRSADLLARLGIAMADAFIGCWKSKYEFDLLRPVTYIRKHIDPQWQPILITPPFPEYPSGHSTQSGAAAAVLTAFFGSDFAFTDATHERDGLPPRQYKNFKDAASEAAVSRLYGGIHFRAAIERGLEQGACIGAHAVVLKTGA